jgi:hypothetical protein
LRRRILSWFFHLLGRNTASKRSISLPAERHENAGCVPGGGYYLFV